MLGIVFGAFVVLLFLGLPIAGSMIFATLLPSCSCLKQNKEIYNAIVATVTELATLAPVYHLKCLPDREATELCRKTVEG